MQTGSRPFAGSRGRRRIPRVAVPVQLVYPPYGVAAPGMYSGMYGPGTIAYAEGYSSGASLPQQQLHAQAQSYGSTYPAPFGHSMPMGYYTCNQPGYAIAPHTARSFVAGVPARPGPSAIERFGSQWRAVVHNLPWETSKPDLLAVFAQWNPQDAHVMIDHNTGHSKCVS